MKIIYTLSYGSITKDRFQDVGSPGHRICSNLFFFFSQELKAAVKGLLRNIVVKIEISTWLYVQV